MTEAKVKPGEGPCITPGTIAISTGIAESLGVEAGEPVLIKGKRNSVGVIGSVEEIGGNIVYLSRMVEGNVGNAGCVEIEKLDEISIAEKIIIEVMEEDCTTDAEELKKRLTGLFASEGDRIFLPGAQFGKQSTGVVLKAIPKGVVQLGKETEIIIKKSFSEIMGVNDNVNFSSIGGFKEILNSIMDLQLRLINQPVLEDYGSGPIKGVILHGPSGLGKTLLLKSLANESRINCILVGASELSGLNPGEAESKLKEIFSEARENAPSIICIDDLEFVCAKKNDYSHSEEKRTLAVLVGLIDNLSLEERVMVIATSRDIEEIDHSLRRSGRFDKEIEINLPNAEERREIIEIYIAGFPLEDSFEIANIVGLTHGYGGADIELLCKDAFWNCIKRNCENIRPDLEIRSEEIRGIEVSESDFVKASRDINPSIGRAVIADIPKVNWNDIGGYRDVKDRIEKDVIFLWKNMATAKEYGVELPKGILLYGPPGTGKTYMAKAVATEVNSKVIVVRASSLLSKWFGEYERNIAHIFNIARKTSPVVLIIDEVENIAAKRGGGVGEASRAMDSGLNVLLQQIDGVEACQDIFIICITNRPDILDEAFTREGRIGKHIYVGNPDPEARKEIFRVHLRKQNVKIAPDVRIDELSQLTDGAVGATIKEIVRNSISEAFYEFLINDKQGEFSLSRKHLLSAIKSVHKEKRK